MTCIIGLIDNGTVYMGADSAAGSDWNVIPTTQPKVFRVGTLLIGYTTSFRMGQLLQYKLALPEHHEEKSIEEFIMSDFLESVRTCLKKGGFSSIKDSREEGGTFLIGYRERLFRVNDDYGITESSYGFDACGCGENFALGAMKALDHLKPPERILKALEIAACFSNNVMPPFYTLEI